ncbi:hypothetical protein BN2476_160037 [Paraburkholderia piptadeniae]|uniref:Uncharacterized protein n=1 Tax=Paraburkholderia piptadeniae TaxID=1701573 RepID=A0A1N7RSN1_9BURK|nr:hypothetical protein BN2476_160037 [Paraburkholderia piptadeniae]
MHWSFLVATPYSPLRLLLFGTVAEAAKRRERAGSAEDVFRLILMSMVVFVSIAVSRWSACR